VKRGRPVSPGLLTPREQQVLALLAEGLTNAQIAARLGISVNGAKYHVAEILAKLGLADRRQAALWYRRSRPGTGLFAAFAARLRLTTPVRLLFLPLAALLIGLVALVALTADRSSPANPAATGADTAATAADVGRKRPAPRRLSGRPTYPGRCPPPTSSSPSTMSVATQAAPSS
jgi:DNA-binding CsgD family transcriptional regulator